MRVHACRGQQCECGTGGGGGGREATARAGVRENEVGGTTSAQELDRGAGGGTKGAGRRVMVRAQRASAALVIHRRRPGRPTEPRILLPGSARPAGRGCHRGRAQAARAASQSPAPSGGRGGGGGRDGVWASSSGGRQASRQPAWWGRRLDTLPAARTLSTGVNFCQATSSSSLRMKRRRSPLMQSRIRRS